MNKYVQFNFYFTYRSLIQFFRADVLQHKCTSSSAEKAKVEHVLAVLQGSSYGARLEVSFMNMSKYELVSAYESLRELGRDCIATHCILSSLFSESKIPLETMRFSPIQVVSTPSLVSLVSFQARLLNKIYRAIFDKLVNGKLKYYLFKCCANSISKQMKISF